MDVQFTATELTKHFSGHDRPVPVGEQRRLLVKLLRLYASEGVVGADGHHLPLCRVCEHHRDCWRSLSYAKPRGKGIDNNGALPLPWIGRSYAPGGLVVLGINLRDASGQFIEWDLGTIQRDELRQGAIEIEGSMFAHRSARSAGAILRAKQNLPLLDHETDPTFLSEVIDSTARVQAVKCSPKVPRGTPGKVMTDRCPEKFLRKELEILRPATILAFGESAYKALEAVGPLEPTYWDPGDQFMQRGHLRFGRSLSEYFWMSHPSSPKWNVAQRYLRAWLKDQSRTTGE